MELKELEKLMNRSNELLELLEKDDQSDTEYSLKLIVEHTELFVKLDSIFMKILENRFDNDPDIFNKMNEFMAYQTKRLRQSKYLNGQ